MSRTRDSRPEAQTETADGAPPSPSAQPAGAVPYAPAGTAGRGRGAPRPATTEKRDWPAELARAVEAGESTMELARRLGVTTQAVGQQAARHKVQLRREKAGLPRLHLDEDKIRAMRDAGASIRQIAAALGASVPTVWQRLRELGSEPAAAPASTWGAGRAVEPAESTSPRIYCVECCVELEEKRVHAGLRLCGECTRQRARELRDGTPLGPRALPPGPALRIVAAEAFRARVQERRAAGEQWAAPTCEHEARLCIAVMLGEAGLDRLMGAAA